MKTLILAFILANGFGFIDSCDPSPTSSSSSDNDPRPQISTGIIDGRVTNAVSHNRIEGVLVCLDGDSNCTESSSDGWYELTPPRRRTYTVVATHQSYKPDTTIVRVGEYDIRLNIKMIPY